MKWTMRGVVICLVSSCLFTLVAFYGCFFYWVKFKTQKMQDPQYNISALIQTGPEKEALQSVYLAELLNLSVDKPTNLYAFNLKSGERKLLSSPLIAEARIKKMFPNVLYIDYSVRKPVAKLGDYQNIAIDKDGYLFPIAPFHAPKELPEIYLGLPDFNAPEDSFGRQGGAWHVPLQNKYFAIALEILHFLEGFPGKDGLRIKRIDVSNAFAQSLGQREIVLFTEEELIVNQNYCVFPKMLRISPKDYIQQMYHFFSLRKNMMEDYSRQLAHAVIPHTGKFSSRIVDLRISHLAFVENESRSD